MGYGTENPTEDFGIGMFVPQGDFTLGDTTDVSGTAKEGFVDKPFCRQTAPTEKKTLYIISTSFYE